MVALFLFNSLLKCSSEDKQHSFLGIVVKNTGNYANQRVFNNGL